MTLFVWKTNQENLANKDDSSWYAWYHRNGDIIKHVGKDFFYLFIFEWRLLLIIVIIEIIFMQGQEVQL